MWMYLVFYVRVCVFSAFTKDFALMGWVFKLFKKETTIHTHSIV